MFFRIAKIAPSAPMQVPILLSNVLIIFSYCEYTPTDSETPIEVLDTYLVQPVTKPIRGFEKPLTNSRIAIFS